MSTTGMGCSTRQEFLVGGRLGGKVGDTRLRVVLYRQGNRVFCDDCLPSGSVCGDKHIFPSLEVQDGPLLKCVEFEWVSEKRNL